MTDASGDHDYTYDLRDRLTQKVTPEGTLTYTYDAAGEPAVDAVLEHGRNVGELHL